MEKQMKILKKYNIESAEYLTCKRILELKENDMVVDRFTMRVDELGSQDHVYEDLHTVKDFENVYASELVKMVTFYLNDGLLKLAVEFDFGNFIVQYNKDDENIEEYIAKILMES